MKSKILESCLPKICLVLKFKAKSGKKWKWQYLG